MLLRCMQRHFRSKVPPKVPPLFGRDAFLEREQWGIPAADSKSRRQKLLCNICTSTSWVMSLCVTYWMLLHRIALAWDSKAEAWSSGRDAAKAKALSSGRDALLDREQNGIWAADSKSRWQKLLWNTCVFCQCWHCACPVAQHFPKSVSNMLSQDDVLVFVIILVSCGDSCYFGFLFHLEVWVLPHFLRFVWESFNINWFLCLHFCFSSNSCPSEKL